MDGVAGSGSAMAGPNRNSCLNALIVALNETCDGTKWYTSTKELQLVSLDFCVACRTYETMHLIIAAGTPRRLLEAADSTPPLPKRLGRTRVPRLRARRVTWHVGTEAQLRNPIFAMTVVDCLKFRRTFEGTLEAVAWPRRLKTIEFHRYSRFNKPIHLVKWPADLQRLEFGFDFDQPLDRVEFPASLQRLLLDGWFNHPIAGVVLPTSLQQLVLGTCFNQPIGGVAWPPSLQQLRFGAEFNQPIARVVLPVSLEELEFGEDFDQPIEEIAWPPSLQQLRFGRNFSKPIERAKFPASLKIFTIDSGAFNQPIERVAWPTSLQELSFGTRFNQPVETVWPDSLQRLVLGMWFNQPVDNVSWPASLEEITFGSCEEKSDNRIAMYSKFNHRIGSSIWPERMRRLTLGHRFRQPLQGLGAWMPSLETLRLLDYDSGHESLLRGIEWPKGLRELTVFGDSDLEQVEIPSTVELLHVENVSVARKRVRGK